MMVKEEEEDIITVLFFQRLVLRGLGERLESVGLQVCLNLNVPHQTYI